MSVIIREALLEDLDQMVKLWFEIMTYHEGHNPYFQKMDNHKETVPVILQTRMKNDNETFFVAEENEEIVGMLLTRIVDLPPTVPFKKQGYIAETIVSSGSRSNGIGEALVNHAKVFFASQGCDVMDLQVSIKNEAGFRFWKKMGFEPGTYHMISLV